VLDLTADQVLSTTRSVRKRLDLTRPVEREVLEECLNLAQQASTTSNHQQWHFVAVSNSETRAALGELYRQGWASYMSSARSLRGYDCIRDSARFLVDHIDREPIHVIPCIEERLEGAISHAQAATWGSILPSVWSFMLAARARGLVYTLSRNCRRSG
jgi:nitroreductase